jgi:hypothetical protein
VVPNNAVQGNVGFPRCFHRLRYCFDVEAVRLLLNAERNRNREPHEAVEVGALRAYDRPQPTTRNYDQLLNYSGSEVIQ